jgi:hypothetical protein
LAAGTDATAAAVLLAAANNALTLSAIADSLSPILSIILKISPVCLDPKKKKKIFKNAVEKHCVNGSQEFAVCGRKIYKIFADFTLC